MKIITSEEKIEEVLSRGVHEIFTKEELRKKLLSGERLHLKLGTDVTGAQLHLGHAVVHRKIRDFQELGHRVTLIIGDFTTLVGDHSDKIDARPETTPAEIKKFEKTYQEQFFKTVLKAQTKIRHNSEWLSKLSFKDGISLAKLFSLQQMLDRETFKIRYQSGKSIDMDEFSYPLMQGYDSVALKADVEFGGTDQTFNLLAGRKIMSCFKLEPQCAMVMKLLLGSDGKPMGKSLSNFIPINASPEEMYGKLMSIVDDVIFDYFELVTRVPMSEVEQMKVAVKSGQNPISFKKRLAKEVVSFYHGEKKAKEAEQSFESIFQKKEIPEEMEEIKADAGELLSEILVKNKIISSKSEWRRLVQENAVHDLFKNQNITDSNLKILGNLTLKIGKKKFVKISVK